MWDVYTGNEFNSKYSCKKFYKITNSIETHNEMKYVTGMNIDINGIRWQR